MSKPKLLVPMTWQQFDDDAYVFGCPECLGAEGSHTDNCSLNKSARSMEALEKQLLADREKEPRKP